jgi:hypothetical protein
VQAKLQSAEPLTRFTLKFNLYIRGL